MMARVDYSINGTYFRSFDAHVSKSNGLIDKLEPKKVESHDWPEYHGKQYDLSAARKYKERSISLDMFFVGDDWRDLLSKFNTIMSEFDSPGTQRLIVEPFGFDALVFDVIQSGEVSLDKTFREGRMFGTCRLTMIEPNPVKCVLKLIGSELELKYESDQITTVNIDGNSSTYDGDVEVEDSLCKRHIDSLEFGGRNLLFNSDFKKPILSSNGTYDNWGQHVGKPSVDTDEGIVTIHDGEEISQQVFEENTEYMLSFEGRGDADAVIRGSSSIISKTFISMESEFKRYTLSISLNEIGSNSRLIIGADSGDVEVRKVKLEKGTRDTDWTVAIEEIHFITISGDIKNLETNAEEIIYGNN